MDGNIFNILRFCVDDGPGIRTSVFLKGCPLRCAWCHNPESQKTTPQILYSPKHCISCGACVSECPNHLHQIENGIHLFFRESCTACGVCAEHCYADALTCCGKTASIEEVMMTVTKDLEFYQNSGGGLTITGGEPFFQSGFSIALAKAAKKAGIHVCMETSGFCETADLLEIAPLIDLFLYDYKIWDENLHKKYTGVSNRLILKNLQALSASGAEAVLRCPIIPDINLCDDHFDSIVRVAAENRAVKEIHLLPYHPLGISKNHCLGSEAPYQNPEFLDKSVLIPYAEYLRNKTGLPVKL